MSEPRGVVGGGRQLPGKREGPTVRLSVGWQLPESHLLPDAVVAFVDGELSPGAHERAAAHIISCACCAAEVDAQRQVRAAMHESHVPSMPAGLLANLCSIPENTELPTAPDNLAVTEDGQLVAVQRPARTPLGSPLGTAPLGSSAPLGSVGLGARKGNRRTVQGAGVVVSGLVLSALALTMTAEDGPSVPGQGDKVPAANTGVVPARFAGEPAHPATTSLTPTSTPEVTGVLQR